MYFFTVNQKKCPYIFIKIFLYNLDTTLKSVLLEQIILKVKVNFLLSLDLKIPMIGFLSNTKG